MLDMFFDPKSVVVIGASANPAKIGHMVLKNLVDDGFAGDIYGVNPKETEILGKQIFPSIQDVPGEIDLAIVVIPSTAVPAVVQECAAKGVRGAVIITAGFRESGPAGAALEQQIRAAIADSPMRIIGPNCLGIMSTHAKLNASFVGKLGKEGNVAFISQSGALCAAVLDWSYGENLGFSKFVSIGNQVDVTEADLLAYLGEDEQTGLIMLYAEEIRSGRTFMEVTEQVSHKKPIIGLKSGRTEAGQLAVSSHTGSLAGDDHAYSLAFKQPGAIRCRRIADLFNLTKAMSSQPLLTGKNLAIVTNAGGPGVMTTDAIEDMGMHLAKFSDQTTKALRDNLPQFANIHNPVDVLGDALPERFGFALEKVLADEYVDGVIVILTPQAMTDVVATAEIIGEKAKGSHKPVLCSWMGKLEVDKANDVFAKYNIPHYPYPESAVYVMQKMFSYFQRKNLRQRSWLLPDRTVERNAEATAIIARAKSENRTSLSEMEGRDVMRHYGLPISPGKVVQSADEAVAHANLISYPVVLKIVSPDILHKSDIGAILINLRDEQAVRDAYETIMENVKREEPDARIDGMLVDPMVLAHNQQVILGMKRTPQFGPMLMVGLGGIFVNVLKDVSFRLVPLIKEDALEMLKKIKSFPILSGIRGEEPYDVDTIADSLVKLSQLVIDFPEIQELDINPLMVFRQGDGAIGVDVKVLIG